MSTIASLSEPRAKLARARHHLETFNQTTQTILKSYRESVVVEFDSNTSEEIWVFHGKVEPIPVEASLLIGDCLYNLRSALDYLVWQLVLAEGNIPTRDNAFPISETQSGFNAIKGRYLSGLGTTAQTRIEGLHPYKGGDDFLYTLHTLMNIDKHRHLHVAVVSLLYVMRLANDTQIAEPTINFGPVKEGAELLRCPKGAVNMYTTPALEIAFSEQDVGSPSAKAWLVFFLQRADEIVHSFSDLLSA